jgi:hypothetical protein
MPHAIDLSFASPIIKPRLPSIKLDDIRVPLAIAAKFQFGVGDC